MSQDTNTILMERAHEMMEYWAGTIHEKLILFAIKMNDLDMLEKNVSEAEAQASQEEFHHYDAI